MRQQAPKAPRKRYRQRSALAVGTVLLLGAATTIVLLAIEGGQVGWRAAGWLVVVAVLAYVVFIRPAVTLTGEGVRLSNLVRDVDLPWSQVDAVDRRWNLVVETPLGRTYTAWAISSSAGRPRARQVGRSAGRVGSMGLGLSLARILPSPDAVVTRGQVDMVASAIESARDEYEQAVAVGQLESQDGQRVRRRVAVAPLAALGAALVAALAAVFG